MQGRLLELYFVDGKPDGMLTAEVFNWTGHVLKIPRTRIADGLARPEAGYTGVYILAGEDDGDPKVYVGEAETLNDRIRQHLKSKDWWDNVILITTAGDALHKAHIKYLEARLIETARTVGAGMLENGNTPTKSSLNEAAASNMEAFLETLLIVLPAIRVDHFDLKRRSPASREMNARTQPTQTNLRFSLSVPRHGIAASARLEDGEMVIEAGSRVQPTWIGKSQERNSYFKLHAGLLASGVIIPDGELGVFTEDYAFASPSAAAAVACGRAANGRTTWLLADTQQTYADWELTQIEEPAS